MVQTCYIYERKGWAKSISSTSIAVRKLGPTVVGNCPCDPNTQKCHFERPYLVTYGKVKLKALSISNFFMTTLKTSPNGKAHQQTPKAIQQFVDIISLQHYALYIYMHMHYDFRPSAFVMDGCKA